MVLSLPDNLEGDSPSSSPDVAACRGKSWLVRLQRGLGGVIPPFYAIPSGDVGRHGNGNTVTCEPLSNWKDGEGGWERSNSSPTGGRQHVGDGMSSNGVTQGDDLGAKGAVALGRASGRGRRIAQACNADQYGSCGVSDRGWISGVGAGSREVTRGWTRVQHSGRVGKPTAWNIWSAKGLRTDCTAKHAHCSAGRTTRKGRKVRRTWELPCYTSNGGNAGRQGGGATATRFKRFERGGNAPVSTVYRTPGVWAESGHQGEGVPPGTPGKSGREVRQQRRAPGHRGLAPEVSAVGTG